MIDYGPNRHTIRTRTHMAAFARVRKFVESYAEVTRATSGFGGNQAVTFQQIAEDLAELDQSDPGAGLNGYLWTLEIAIWKTSGLERAPTGKGRLELLAHAGLLSVELCLQFEGTPDEATWLLDAVQTTMGIQLKPSKSSRIPS